MYGYINRIVTLASTQMRLFEEEWGLPRLDGEFGEDVHVADPGRHPKLSALFFDPDNGGLAAYPTLLAGRKFGGKDQHQFDLSSLLHAGLGVEVNSVGADVAGLGGMIGAVCGAQARGNTGGDSGSGAALGIGLHAGCGTTYCTPMPETGEEIPGSVQEPGIQNGTR